MKQALAPLLFDEDDPEQAQFLRQSVVASSQRSYSTVHKLKVKQTVVGLPVHRFQSLLVDLATVVKKTSSAQASQCDSL